jgi:hypothetical protein
MMQGMEDYLRDVKKKKIKALGDNITDEKLSEILSIRPRAEKIAIKDAKLRTFITNDTDRSEMVAHVYDITYGTIRRGIDNMVVIDDSIVRGTTLKKFDPPHARPPGSEEDCRREFGSADPFTSTAMESTWRSLGILLLSARR